MKEMKKEAMNQSNGSWTDLELEGQKFLVKMDKEGNIRCPFCEERWCAPGGGITNHALFCEKNPNRRTHWSKKQESKTRKNETDKSALKKEEKGFNFGSLKKQKDLPKEKKYDFFEIREEVKKEIPEGSLDWLDNLKENAKEEKISDKKTNGELIYKLEGEVFPKLLEYLSIKKILKQEIKKFKLWLEKKLEQYNME